MQINIPARVSTTRRAGNNLSIIQRVVLFLAVVSVRFAGANALVQNVNAGGDSVGGLRLSLVTQKGDSVKEPKFRVELFNTGKNDLMLNLGMMLANGKNQYPDAINLTLTDAKGKSRELELIGPPGIAGRVDPMIVPLPVGAAYTILVDLRQYWCPNWSPNKAEFKIELSQGTYSLQAHYTGKRVSKEEANLDMQGFALMPFWTGTVSSKELQFNVSTEH